MNQVVREEGITVTAVQELIPGAVVYSSRHRYVILRRSVPVFTTNNRKLLVSYLWGKDIKDNYVVYDYERPYPVDTPNLTAWIKRLKETA